MKKIFLLFATLFLLNLSTFAQNSPHPTIIKLEISYMSVPNDQVIPEVMVHLKTWTGVSKVYCKIIDPIANSIVYSLNYTVNTMPVTNASGVTICLKNNMLVQMLETSAVPLKGYTYQIQTEDSQGNMSTNYSL